MLTSADVDGLYTSFARAFGWLVTLHAMAREPT